MKSLHEEVRQRRAADATELPCVGLQPSGASLMVCQWQRESWVLPWAQFIGARLGSPEGEEQLELSFANYRVTVTGENLGGLLDDLAAQRIGCLRDLPASYRARIADDAPFVARIEVQPVAGASSSAIRETPG